MTKRKTAKTPMKETAEDMAVTRAALENSGAKLVQHVHALEELAVKADDLKAAISAGYDAAKADGFDKKAVKKLIKRRAMTEEQIRAAGDLDLVVSTYEAAVGLAENGAALE